MCSRDATVTGRSEPLLRLAILVLFAWGVLVMFQDRQLYFPDNPPRPTLLSAAAREGLAPWPDGDNFRGLLREPHGRSRGTVVLFHGNAGHAGHRGWYAEAFAALGLRTILAEYPAYGSRPGKLGEASLVADARETLALARQQFAGPLVVAGESLGAGVAAAAVADRPGGVAALLLITPWDRLEAVARHHFPWLPVGLLLRDRYDSAANLAGFRGPVAVVLAERDSIVPAEFGNALFAALAEPKRLWLVPAADHNDWLGRVDGAWWQDVGRFLLAD